MSIDIPSLVTSVVPLDDIANALIGDSASALSNLVSDIPNQIAEIEEQEEAAEKEPNEVIKEKAKERLEEQKQKLEDLKQQMQDQLNAMIEDMKQKVQEWLDSANIYAQEIAIAAEAIPAAAQSYVEAGIEIGVQTTLLISAATKAAAAISIGVDLTDSVAAQSANLKASVEEYNSAKEQLKAAIASFNTAVFNVEDILAPIAAIPILGPTIMAAVMVPINTAKGIVDTAAEVII